MSRAYDTRPDLEGYDAFTLRGFAKYMLPLAALFGAEFLANRFGLDRWFFSLIQLAWIAFALKLIWDAAKALATGKPLPDDETAPRYAEQTGRHASPRLYAVGVIIAGALLALLAVLRIAQILSE